MNIKKLLLQLGLLALVILAFVATDLFIYNNFTKIYSNPYSETMAEKSIDIDKYLPFDENSLIVKKNSETKITENIPVVDGATALYRRNTPRQMAEREPIIFLVESRKQKDRTACLKQESEF